MIDDDHFRISRRRAAWACGGVTPAVFRHVTLRREPHQTAAAKAALAAPPMPTRLAKPGLKKCNHNGETCMTSYTYPQSGRMYRG
jgi:hypothetical protein